MFFLRGRGGYKGCSSLRQSNQQRFIWTPDFLMPNDTPTSTASLPALLPETDHARVDLDDNVANFYHRLDRLKQKQTTKTSVLNALTAIVPVCVCI